MSKKIIFFIFFSILFLNVSEIFACESCTIPRLGREKKFSSQESSQQKWFAEYLYEEQNWDEMEARAAHQLHHQGRHFHDKTVEQFQHVMAGYHPTADWTVFTEIPYVTRHSIEIDSHAALGSSQTSQGLGDLSLVGHYRFWKKDAASLGAVAGIKFPTGFTGERNSIGSKFEPEMQPGSGSFDYITGAVYQKGFGRVGLLGNVAYVFKTPGGQDFEFGDLFSTSLLLDYALNPQSKFFKTKIGLDLNLQHEQRQEDKGATVADSGGKTLLLGPAVVVEGSKNISVFSSFHTPVMQNLGGVHQELDFAWTAGGKVHF